MNHPLLTKVLADTDCMHVPLCGTAVEDAKEAIGSMPPDIADRLEKALDVCAVCGNHKTSWFHLVEGEYIHSEGQWHPYQPLVTP